MTTFRRGLSFSRPELTLGQKLWNINWMLVILIAAISTIGFGMLYSASNGNWDPWASRQITRFGVGVFAMLLVAVIDIRFWMRYAYLFYAAPLLLLASVELVGTVGMGAQRWIDLRLFQLQPSELMKVALVLALARYFHGLTMEEIGRPHYLITPLVLVMAPIILVLRQPDLGTALLILIASGALFFAAGVRIWKFALVIICSLAAIPIAWEFLHEYQQQRILTFLDPESDPLGAGYHILQSKIALGSGGMFGKGFIQGTQSHLNFLPEKQTDFLFTMLAEEFGMAGGFLLLGLYGLVILYGFAIAVRSRSQFGRLVAIGLATTFFLYVFINVAMVMGLIPVVGVPLPLISYGGTAMLTVLISFGLILSVSVHRDVVIARRGLDTAL